MNALLLVLWLVLVVALLLIVASVSAFVAGLFGAWAVFAAVLLWDALFDR